MLLSIEITGRGNDFQLRVLPKWFMGMKKNITMNFGTEMYETFKTKTKI